MPCTPGTHVIHPTACKRYLSCIEIANRGQYQWHETPCPADTYFNDATDECINPLILIGPQKQCVYERPDQTNNLQVPVSSLPECQNLATSTVSTRSTSSETSQADRGECSRQVRVGAREKSNSH